MCQNCIDSGKIRQSTFDLIERFNDEWPDAEYGPAHIVLADLNIEDGHIDWCLELLKAAIFQTTAALTDEDAAFMREMEMYRSCDPDELKATFDFLTSLRLVPRHER